MALGVKGTNRASNSNGRVRSVGLRMDRDCLVSAPHPPPHTLRLLVQPKRALEMQLKSLRAPWVDPKVSELL